MRDEADITINGTRLNNEAVTVERPGYIGKRYSFMVRAARAPRVRITCQVRSDTERRSPDPMKRRSRKNPFATASAGLRGAASMAANNSIAAEIRAEGVTAGGFHEEGK